MLCASSSFFILQQCAVFEFMILVLKWLWKQYEVAVLRYSVFKE